MMITTTHKEVLREGGGRERELESLEPKWHQAAHMNVHSLRHVTFTNVHNVDVISSWHVKFRTFW